VIFDGMIQTVVVIWTKDVSIAFGVNRISILPHSLTPWFSFMSLYYKIASRFYI
jgi:hypothetical protein